MPIQACNLYNNANMADENLPPTDVPAARSGGNAFLTGLKEHRLYRVALGYAVGAWVVLQVAAIVLPGFGAPAWVLRALMIVLALGFGAALLAGWGYDRRVAGRSLLPHAPAGRVGWGLAALLPAAAVTGFFLLRPLPHPVEGVAPAPTTTAPAAPAVSEKSVAVLPFENLSDDKANGYFTDGVQDEILTDLAKVADLRVIARASVRQYKADAPRDLRAIAAELGVAHVLTGSVQRAGNQVRVHAQLIDVRTAVQQWGESYLKPLDDVFAIQSEIALAIVGQLQARLSPQEKSAIDQAPTTDVAAYDLYLRAQEIFERNAGSAQGGDKTAEAIPLLEQALARDPKFLAAQCLLARLHGDLYRSHDHSPARLEQFSAAVQGAVRLAPDAGETHLALAEYHYQRRDYAAAAAELTLAGRILPNHPRIPELTGYLLRRQGRWDEAARSMEQALGLDPHNFLLLQQLGATYLSMHRYADDARVLQRALAVKPGDPFTRQLLADVPLHARADVRPRQATLATLLAENPDLAAQLDDPGTAMYERSPAACARALSHLPPGGTIVQGGLRLPRAFWEGAYAHFQGDAARAREAFTAARVEVAKAVAARPDPAVALSFLGVIDAGLGRKEEAVVEGQHACELLPVAKDALVGPDVLQNLAGIYAWTGEKKEAVETLAALLRVPNHLTYGELRLDPLWDALRGDPGFEALVASQAPKPTP